MIRTLNDHGVETDAPIEIVNWTNEEGARFAPPMVASGVFAGVFTLEQGQGKTDADGKTIGEELRRIGYEGAMACAGRPYTAYFEPHIEQGPILEREGKPIGAVTGAQGARWFEVTVEGQEGHAGATPDGHATRRAGGGRARMIVDIQKIGLGHSPNGRATVGIVKVGPGSPNVVPGSVFMTVDIRHPDAGVIEEMTMELREAGERLAAELATPIAVKETWYSPPVAFDHSCVDAVREAARAYGYEAPRHRQRRGARRRLRRGRGALGDDLRALRRRDQSQRGGERVAVGSDRRLQRSAARGAEPRRRALRESYWCRKREGSASVSAVSG